MKRSQGLNGLIIKQKQKARKRHDQAREHELNKEIKKGARRDKKLWRTRKLEEWSDPRKNWKHIKREKSEFKPNFYGMKDLEGNRVPLNQKAEAIACYLHQKQWSPKEYVAPRSKVSIVILEYLVSRATVSNRIFKYFVSRAKFPTLVLEYFVSPTKGFHYYRRAFCAKGKGFQYYRKVSHVPAQMFPPLPSNMLGSAHRVPQL